MANKVRTVSTPPAQLVQTGERNQGFRFLAGSMGAAMPHPDGGEKFEAATELSEREIAEREAALGLSSEPEPVRGKPSDTYVPPGHAEEVRRVAAFADYVNRDADLSTLPDRFTLEIERKGDGWWKVTAPAVHIGLFIAHQDLATALADAPAALAEIVRLDGQVPAAKRRGKK